VGWPPRLIRPPWWTLALVAGALVAWAWPGLAARLVYDRVAIGDGELWRLASGHLVHFSTAHLAANLGVLLVAGAALEHRDPRATAMLYGLAMPFIGVVLWLVEPSLAVFGGASGIVFAVLTAFALDALARPGRQRLVGGALLAGLCIKLVAELGFGWSTGALAPGSDIVAVPASHAAGMAIAILGYPVLRKWTSVPKKNAFEKSAGGESNAKY
jgi:rhomboid family GlyGly-CTERM serine protease